MSSRETDRNEPAADSEIVKSDLQRRWSDGAPSTYRGNDASAPWSMVQQWPTLVATLSEQAVESSNLILRALDFMVGAGRMRRAEAKALSDARPLWISIYDSTNVGPQELADGLLKWIPPDVGVFFQDGVGVYARRPWVALHYAHVLERSLGKGRVRIIAEAFRPKEGGGFRPATIDELRPQLATYAGLPIYLFEGPRYVPPALVEQLVKAGAGKPQ